MSATNATETGILALLITNADGPANMGDATGPRGSATAGVFWISLHTDDPGEAGNQTTNEAAYTSYARQDEARNTTQWTVTDNVADNDNAISFPAATGGGETEQDFGLGAAETSTGTLFFKGALTAGLAVSSGITPSFAAGALDISLD